MVKLVESLKLESSDFGNALSSSVPYPPIERLGIIGDRRTAALIAADGTLCWMCLPNYDGPPTFGALLDLQSGGSWKLGPASPVFGEQSYLADAFVLRTLWSNRRGTLELVDTMGFPETERAPGAADRRVVLRRLRCLSGTADCYLKCEPRRNLAESFRAMAGAQHVDFLAGDKRLMLWASGPLGTCEHFAEASFRLSAGEEVWYVLGPNEDAGAWSLQTASRLLQAAKARWRNWAGRLDCQGSRRDQIRRSGLLVHLLTFAPSGAIVASPSASLPERIGGRRNFDYRYTWIRDASLALELHSELGATSDARHFFQWLSKVPRGRKMPLQVLYDVHGGTEMPVIEREELYGYRGSGPVRFGNPATSILEMDSFGYLAHCALRYLDRGGQWDAEFWNLISTVAEFTASNWQRKGASIWEISPEHDFVITRVMSWVTLDRALRIADKLGLQISTKTAWQSERDAIHAEVMTRGWSDRLGSFRQRYGADTVDASLLLIPLMDFLPFDHARVTSTMERIRDQLEVNGLLQRFVPSHLPGQGRLPLGEEEGAFLMCSFWLAQLHARRDEIDEAEAILDRAESIAGPLGLFAEGADARSNTLLGNMPLIFSQVEYAKAALALGEAERRRAASQSGVSPSSQAS